MLVLFLSIYKDVKRPVQTYGETLCQNIDTCNKQSIDRIFIYVPVDTGSGPKSKNVQQKANFLQAKSQMDFKVTQILHHVP